MLRGAIMLHRRNPEYKPPGLLTEELVTQRKIKARFATVLGLAAATTLAGCASTPEPVIGAAVTAPRSDLGQDAYSSTRPDIYLLRPTDKISVSVFREPDLSAPDLRIGVEGNVSLPMLGSIPAAGQTAKQFEQDVTRRLAALGVKSPLVSVNVTEFASHLVTVEGAVQQPGVFAFQPGSRLSSAIAMASGPTRIAKTEQIAVFRESPQGMMIAKFDYQQISSGAMLDPVLEPGDRIVMGTDGLSVFWDDILKTLPVFGTFAVVATR
jgi:polysaccharide biosynthesis/export protein